MYSMIFTQVEAITVDYFPKPKKLESSPNHGVLAQVVVVVDQTVDSQTVVVVVVTTVVVSATVVVVVVAGFVDHVVAIVVVVSGS